MKITAVTSYPVKVGFRNQFIVKIDTDEGISGIGEGGMSGRELAMAGMVEHLSRWLIGEDPGRIEHHWQTCYRTSYFEGGNILTAALSAIDIALWDIQGKRLGVPVYKLLGGACRDYPPVLRDPGRAGRTRHRRASEADVRRGLERPALSAGHEINAAERRRGR